jgi:hypothetical protein
LWGWKKDIWIELLLCWLVSINGNSQELSLKEMIARSLFRNSMNIRNVPEKARFTHELEYSLTANGFILINWLHDNKVNQVNLFQNLKFQCVLQDDKIFRFTGTFIHNLGFLHYFDSITKVNIDDNSLSNRLDIKIDGRFAFTINSCITSRFMNGYDYLTNDSGQLIKVLNSSFLTPLIWTFSMGLGYTFKSFGSVNLGLSAARLTYILNDHIFEIRRITSYYGINEGRNNLLEYGFTFQLLIDKYIFKKLHWNCDLALFKNYNSPVDLTFKNMFGLKINKFLTTNLQTRIFYEEKLSKHFQFENLLSIGFCYHL